jgi:hypothetical protein
MRNTFLVLAGLLVLHVGASRLLAIDESATSMKRATPADLATLRDFTAILVEGDFALEVVQGAEYSVDFAPPNPDERRFYAVVHDGTLLLGGFGNGPGSRARVTLPALSKLNAGRVEALSVSGFDGEQLSVQAERVRRVTLKNNRVREWRIRAEHVVDLQIDRASISAGKVDLSGHAVLNVID